LYYSLWMGMGSTLMASLVFQGIGPHQ